MSKQTGGPAFPREDYKANGGDGQLGQEGMTIRDYFAIRATEQDIENHRAYKVCPTTGQPLYLMTVEQAKFAYADAMLEARK